MALKASKPFAQETALETLPPGPPVFSRHDGIAGVAGLVFATSAGVVTAHRGALASWAPAPGGDLFDCEILFGLKAHLLEHVVAQGRSECLPAVTLDLAGGRCTVDINIDWNDRAEQLRLIVRDAAWRKQAVASAVQMERQRRVLCESLAGIRSAAGALRRGLVERMAENPEAPCQAEISRLWRFENLADRLCARIEGLARRQVGRQ